LPANPQPPVIMYKSTTAVGVNFISNFFIHNVCECKGNLVHHSTLSTANSTELLTYLPVCI